MKLFVYCPSEYYGKEDSPQWQEACVVSKKHKLAIVSNIEGLEHLLNPQVVAMPEKRYRDIDETVNSGFVHKIDITDEFCEMSKESFARFVDPDGLIYEQKPILVEKHKLKFRTRHSKKGIYKVIIVNNESDYLESGFEVL